MGVLGVLAGCGGGENSPTVPQSGAPSVNSNPKDCTVEEGAPAIFSVSATGNPTPSYKWSRDGKSIPGATGSTYTTGPTVLADTGARFQVMVTNPAGSVSREAVLHVTALKTLPAITLQPSDCTASQGSQATFRVRAVGVPEPTYEWKRDGKLIPGATSRDYVLENIALADDGATFQAMVVNSQGSAPSKVVTLRVTATGSAPVIKVQPAPSTVPEGGKATFAVQAEGIPAPTYQWVRNGTAILDAKSPTLSVDGVILADDGAKFWAVVSNSLGSLNSNEATLKVQPADNAPIITTDPVSLTVTEGGKATFSTQASGQPAPTFVWRRNGVVIPGALGADYVRDGIALSDNQAIFDAVATNTLGSAASKPATLTVLPKVAQGIQVSFNATPGGSLVGELVQSVQPGGSTSTVTAVPSTNKNNPAEDYAFNFWSGGIPITRSAALTIPNVTQSFAAKAFFSNNAIGTMAVDIGGIDSLGAPSALSDYMGSVIMVVVDAAWCTLCLNDSADVEAVHQQFAPQGLKVVTVLAMADNYRIPTQAGLQDWVSKTKYTFKVMNDMSGAMMGVANKFYVGKQAEFPTYALIDKKFNIRYFARGISAMNTDWKAKITQLLAE